MYLFFIKAAYYVVTLLGRTIFRRAIEENDIEERKKATAIVDDEYIRLCYNWEE